MGDLIDRQAAIDAAIDAADDWDGGYGGYSLSRADMIERAINNLPSARPEPIKVSVDREMTEEELKELKKKIADSPVVLLPSAQPEPAIPLQWIEAQIEWLKSLDNAFSDLTAGQISAMVNKWKDEQNE